MQPARNTCDSDPVTECSVGTSVRWSEAALAKAVIALMVILFVAYLVAFVQSMRPWWFHPAWTTDDALQQIYPFHRILDAELFKDDLITTMMTAYLAPIHYWICALVTRLTGDPIMMGHWVMLLQLSLTVGFVFLAVKRAVGWAPALFAAVWMLHSRRIVQRMTGGLPRGWAAPLFAAFFYFVLSGNHVAVLLLLAVGCLLHPPATLAMAIAYGLFLMVLVFSADRAAEGRRWLSRYVLLSPLYIVLVLSVVQMPAEIGTMADYATASQMPEFQSPTGRFPFLPFPPLWDDLRLYGFHAFTDRFSSPVPYIVVALLAALAVASIYLKRELVPVQAWCFLVGAMVVYALSRELAFRLYVPNRHLQFPLAFFMIVGFTIAAWRIGACARTKYRPLFQLACLCLLAAIIGWGSGLGLKGPANFNYTRDQRGRVIQWIAKYTPKDALIAGEPTFIDPVQLFAKRTAYVTSETAHPFYDTYYAEMKRRLEITLRAHYAPDLRTLLEIVEPEGIDYFVFEKKRFYPRVLATATYFPPFDGLVRTLTSRDAEQYAYKQLPKSIDLANAPYMPYRDDRAAVVEIAALRRFLDHGFAP